jgi:hypothetical protein
MNWGGPTCPFRCFTDGGRPTSALASVPAWGYRREPRRRLGVLVGLLSGSLIAYGVDDDFVKGLSEAIALSSLALFVLFKSVNENKLRSWAWLILHCPPDRRSFAFFAKRSPGRS